MLHLLRPSAAGRDFIRSTTFLLGIFAALGIAGIIIIAPVPFSAGIITATLAGILTLIYPILLPFALVASVPIQDAIPLPESIPLTATRAAIAGAAAVIPIVLLAQRRPLQRSVIMLAIAGYIAALIVSLWSAHHLDPGYAEIYRWAVALLGFWLIIQFVQTRKQVVLLLCVMGVIAIAQGVIGVLQAFLGFGPASFEIGPGFSRAYGTFGMPNSYAAFMETVAIPLIPIGLWAIFRCWSTLRAYRGSRYSGFLRSASDRHDVVQIFAITLIIVGGATAGLAGILVSFSRGGWLGTTGAIVVILLLLGRRAVLTAAVSGSALILVGLLGAGTTLIELFQDRVVQLFYQLSIGDIRGMPITSDNFAALERMAHWQAAIEMWRSNIWFGVGAGNYDGLFREFTVHPQFVHSQGHAHNYYLHVLAETGITGLVAYAILLATATYVSWIAFRSRDPLARAIGIGSLGMTTALVIHNVFENLHVLNISVQIVAIWALAVVAARWSNVAQSETDSTGSESDPRIAYPLLMSRARPDSIVKVSRTSEST